MADCIAEGLWRLDIPLEGNPLKNLNSYLIRGERGLLIDTGFRWASCRLAMERQPHRRGRCILFYSFFVPPGCCIF